MAGIGGSESVDTKTFQQFANELETVFAFLEDAPKNAEYALSEAYTLFVARHRVNPKNQQVAAALRAEHFDEDTEKAFTEFITFVDLVIKRGGHGMDELMKIFSAIAHIKKYVTERIQ